MPGKVFVNYRRDDARDMAARIRDRLAQTFGDTNVFMDVDDLLAGQRFDKELEKALDRTDVFLAVIGPRWMELLAERQASGERDYVRQEIAGALQRGIVAIPVLIERTAPPRAAELPEDIRDLVLHHKHVVTHEQFGRDVVGLVAAIKIGRKMARVNAGGGSARLRWAAAVALSLLLLGGGVLAYQMGAPGRRADERRQEAEAAKVKLAAEKVRQDEITRTEGAAAKKKADEEAQAEYRRRVLKEFKRAVEAKFLTCLSEGDCDVAIANINEAIKFDPRNAEAYAGRGAIYAKKGDYDRAFTDFNKAIEFDPRNPFTYVTRGQVYAEKRDYDRAITDFNKAIEFAPQDASPYLNRGAAYANKGRYDRAMADFNKAIENAPRHASAYSIRGATYAEKGDYDRAITDLNKAIEFDPRHATTYVTRGAAYAKKGDYDRAFTDFSKAIEIDPRSAFAYYARGATYGEKGNYDRAIADFNKAIEIDPRDANAYYKRGLAYERQGRSVDAIRDYRQALKMLPDDHSSRNALKRLGVSP
jgi:tetratricopeptide (TPR) repeat protein